MRVSAWGVKVLVWATGVFLCACNPDADGVRPGAWSVRDSAGVTIVYNDPPSIPRGCISVMSEPRTTIRPSPANDAQVPGLFNVQGGAVLSDGDVVLLNSGTQELLFFSTDGTYQYAVGGTGRGPGEFLSPDWLGRGNGDTLFVWDRRLMRLSTFSGEGVFLASRLVASDAENAGPSGPSMIRGRFDGGSFLVLPIQLVFFGAERSVKRYPQAYRRYDPGTDHTNHLWDGASEETVSGGGGGVYALPFGKTELVLTHGDFFLVADNGTPAIRYYDLRGRLRRVVNWVSDPIRVTDEDKRNFARQMATDHPDVTQERTTTLFASERPRFSAIRSDPLGWLWVRQFAARWEPPGKWLLFDEESVLRCQVGLPSRFEVLDIAENHILGRQRDEFDEETVLVFDIIRN